jgi:hypothetical protein
MFDTARSRHDQGSGYLGLDSPGMFSWFISTLPFGAEEEDRIAVAALPTLSGRSRAADGRHDDTISMFSPTQPLLPPPAPVITSIRER